MSHIKIIFGGAGFNSYATFKDVSAIKEVTALLKKLGVDTIDTARLYGDSEKLMGEAGVAKDFIVDTKIKGGWEKGTATKDGVVSDAKDSLAKVKVDQFDIFYIHGPDSTVPLEDTLAGINEAYKIGAFKRFGLSNFSAEQVQEVYDVCKAKGYVLPTAYQGNYSPVARKLETILFPTLRKLGMSFYAYSPLAGGFLTKTKEQIQEGVGRFSEQAIGGLYRNLYNKPAYLESLEKWNAAAEKEGISKAELAYRWVASNSILKKEHGDGVIFGASSLKQIEQTVKAIKAGPLSDDACKTIEEIWKLVEHEAPIDNYDATFNK